MSLQPRFEALLAKYCPNTPPGSDYTDDVVQPYPEGIECPRCANCICKTVKTKLCNNPNLPEKEANRAEEAMEEVEEEEEEEATLITPAERREWALLEAKVHGLQDLVMNYYTHQATMIGEVFDMFIDYLTVPDETENWTPESLEPTEGPMPFPLRDYLPPYMLVPGGVMTRLRSNGREKTTPLDGTGSLVPATMKTGLGPPGGGDGVQRIN